MQSLRLSQVAKDQLVTLKRRTGISTWNVLCRWALCRSFSETTEPPAAEFPSDSNVEIDWQTFSGSYGDVYVALAKARLRARGEPADDQEALKYIRAHVHRGIGYLVGDPEVANLPGMLRLAVK